MKAKKRWFPTYLKRCRLIMRGFVTFHTKRFHVHYWTSCEKTRWNIESTTSTDMKNMYYEHKFTQGAILPFLFFPDVEKKHDIFFKPFSLIAVSFPLSSREIKLTWSQECPQTSISANWTGSWNGISKHTKINWRLFQTNWVSRVKSYHHLMFVFSKIH